MTLSTYVIPGSRIREANVDVLPTRGQQEAEAGLDVRTESDRGQPTGQSDIPRDGKWGPSVNTLGLLRQLVIVVRHERSLSGGRPVVPPSFSSCLGSFSNLWSYDYEVKYLKGSRQYEADLLSRNPFCGFLSTGQIKDHQGELRRDTRYTLNDKDLMTITRRGVTKIIFPPSLRGTLLQRAHRDINHPGISQMTRLIAAQYYWDGMTNDIRLHHRMNIANEMLDSVRDDPNLLQRVITDLALCDFLLFPKLKRPLKGRRYATLDEIKTASKEELKRFF
ncbi:hypothetical protein LAZ67_6003446 [Cordylochernes scorpioides]|uniref:Integrase zinc-binding domain-containing protein n=1 Tax=Cordylochernes scorpioides TaxID=51811 RepID=A0ABY6KKM1_9ARAC|nr:hypothetical protein LAZ67_6003446 [Cordylochernes scorpioides]